MVSSTALLPTVRKVLRKSMSIQFTATLTCIQPLCHQNSALCVCLSGGQRESGWTSGFPQADWQQRFTGLTFFKSAQQKEIGAVLRLDFINFHHLLQTVELVSRSQRAQGDGLIATAAGKKFETIETAVCSDTVHIRWLDKIMNPVSSFATLSAVCQDNINVHLHTEHTSKVCIPVSQQSV